MSKSPFQKILNIIYEKLSKNTSTMLVITGSLGWALSSAAQIFAVATNPKYTKEQKSFLVPQEVMDAVVNIGTFLVITQLTKKTLSKMASTGKIATSNVRNFLNNHKDLKDKVGKLSLDIDKLIKNKTIHEQGLIDSYYAYKNFTTAVATVGAGVLASNIITPFVRNKVASKVQKDYIFNKNKSTTDNKIKEQSTNFKGYNYNNIYLYKNNGMKI